MKDFFRPVYIAGQTGSGKTGVSIKLAKRLSHCGEIINADAFQIYRGIEILSAAPSTGEQAGVPHHLFGIVPITKECHAAHLASLARGEINRVSGTGVPIVVGGSGLYLKSITHGLAPTPAGDDQLREKLEARDLEDLINEYKLLDPDGAAQTNLKNRRYVTRNLEICLLSGIPASKIKSSWEDNAPEMVGIYLQRSREDIYDRINRRTQLMFEQGVVKQIEELTNGASATAAKAIGFREIQALVAGDISEQECIAAIQQITRRYAKRQETWFKKETQYQQIPCGPEDSTNQIVDRILEIFPLAEIQSRRESQPCPKSKKEIQSESN